MLNLGWGGRGGEGEEECRHYSERIPVEEVSRGFMQAHTRRLSRLTYDWTSRRIEVFQYTEVSSFHGVGIEEFHCIQRYPHFRVLE